MAFVFPEGQDSRTPFGNFAFHVNFELDGDGGGGPPPVFSDPLWGGFSEISGLEASMEHKAIKEGGRNYGTVMRAGQTTFGTVILKRGIVSSRHLWLWWSWFAGADGASDPLPTPGNRFNLLIGLTRRMLANPEQRNQPDSRREYSNHHVAWKLRNAMPVKFKIGDLNAKGTDVAIEELHVVHEGLDMDVATGSPAMAGEPSPSPEGTAIA
jgi:phage tail-like protein